MSMPRRFIAVFGLVCLGCFGAVAAHAEEPAAAATAEPAGAEHVGAAEHHAEPLTWLSIVPESVQESLKHSLASVAPKTFIDKEDFAEKGELVHVFFAIIAFLIVLGTALAARRTLSRDVDAGVLPARKFSPLLVFELIVGAVWNLMRNMMGPDEARRHFPIICTLAVYIFTMNAMALLPLGVPATDNLNTNIVMGLTVFFATHISGLRVQGPIGYLKHFAGPILALAPLMIVIELISHIVRPLSLSLRLLGNMTGDHKVMEEFLKFHLPLVPLPVMFLGLLVVCIQTLVFVLLSTVYLSMAVAKHEEHGDEAHGHH